MASATISQVHTMFWELYLHDLNLSAAKPYYRDIGIAAWRVINTVSGKARIQTQVC